MVFAHSVLMSNLRLSAKCLGMQVTSAPISSLIGIGLLLILGSLNFDTVHSMLADAYVAQTSPLKVGMDGTSLVVPGSTLLVFLECKSLSKVFIMLSLTYSTLSVS